jgi:hypothetical protein
MNLIDEITQADQKLREAEARVTEASRRLRHAKIELGECRAELSRLIQELATGESRFPLLERFAPNGDRLHPTADEHQRGPTEFPDPQTPAPARKAGRPRKDRA